MQVFELIEALQGAPVDAYVYVQGVHVPGAAYITDSVDHDLFDANGADAVVIRFPNDQRSRSAYFEPADPDVTITVPRSVAKVIAEANTPSAPAELRDAAETMTEACRKAVSE